MFTQIVPQLWMMLPKAERDLIAKKFDLKRTGMTEVINEDVVTDGYRMEDLKEITLEKMTAFIGSEESFMRAWELTVMKTRSLLNPPQVFIGTPVQLEELQSGAVLPVLKEVSNQEFEETTGTKIEVPVDQEAFKDSIGSIGDSVAPEIIETAPIIEDIKKVEKETKKGKNKNV